MPFEKEVSVFLKYTVSHINVYFGKEFPREKAQIP